MCILYGLGYDYVSLSTHTYSIHTSLTPSHPHIYSHPHTPLHLHTLTSTHAHTHPHTHTHHHTLTCTHTFTQPLIITLINHIIWLLHTPTHTLTLSFTHPLTHSPIHIPLTHTLTGSTQTQIGDCYNDPNFSCDSANRVEGGVTSPAATCCGLGRLAYTTNSVDGCQICTRKFSVHVSSFLSLVHSLLLYAKQ